MSSLRRRAHVVLVVMVLIGLFGPLVPATAAQESAADPPSAESSDTETSSDAGASSAETDSVDEGRPATVETEAPAPLVETEVPAGSAETEVPAVPPETEAPAEPTETEVPAVPTETEMPAEPTETEVPAEPTETEVPAEPEARSLDRAERSVLIQQAKEGGGFTIQKKVSPEIVEKNSTITYEIVVGFSDQEPGDSFTVNDTVPHQLKNVIGTCGAASGAECNGGTSGNVQAWTITPLVPTGTVYLTISAYVGDLVGQTITNNAYINNDPSLIGSNTFTVVDERPPDTEVTPGIPTVDPGSCVKGVLTLPKLNLPSTMGITYTHSAIPPNGGSIFVTATAGSGYVLPSDLSGDWTLTDTVFFKTASYIIDFPAPVECKVSPEAPTFEDAQCTDGSLTQPKVTLPANTAGIKYTVSPKNPKNGDTVTVTATLQQGYSWGDTSGWNVDGNKATKTHTFTHVKCAVSPASPDFSQARCENGTLTDPSLTVGPTEGVTYTWDTSKVVNGGGDVVITATLKSNDYKWGNLNGWTDNKDGTLSITVKFEKITCAVAPADPGVNQAQCKNGTVTAPSINLKNSAAITYSWDQSKVVNGGGDVVIIATLTGDNYSWQEPLPDGWTKTGDTTAEYTATFTLVPCDAKPGDPTLTQAQCVNGALTQPKLTVTDTAAIKYSWNPADVKNGGKVTVTATLQPNYTWGAMSEGWTKDGNTATKSFLFEEESCKPVVPVNPEWENAQCIGGALTEPKLEATNTDAITYTWDASKVLNGSTVVVTATLADEYAWGDLPSGWKPQGTGKATFEVIFEDITCKGVSPIDPKLTQVTCVNGALTEPKLEATNTDAITYTWDASKVLNGSTVVVTATLADKYAWNAPLPKGWSPDGTDKATFEAIFEPVDCTPVVPVNPEWENAQCIGGALTEPKLEATNTDAITYTWNAADVKNGSTVVVTATLADEYAWGNLPSGWKPKGTGKATFEVIFEPVDCTPVVPAKPDVIQAICSGGIITNPSVTVPANTEAIHYTKSGIGIERPGETVIVTATLQPDFAWGDLPSGWEPKGTGQAIYEIVLDDPTCTPISPAPLNYEQAQCVGGEITDPILTFDNTKGIFYSYDQSKVVNGGSVEVMAFLDTGLSWGDLGDWTYVSTYIARKTFTFDPVECTPVVPVDPDLTQAQCLGGMLTTPSVTFDKTTGITYSYTGGLAPGSKIVVTATVENDFGWPETLPEGWTKIDSAHASAEFTFADAECTEVVPAAPNFENAQCIGGVLTEPTLDLQTTTGITYTTDTDPVNGGKVVVTAKLADTYGWPEALPEGWKKTGPDTASYTVEYDDKACTPVIPVDPEVVNASCIAGELTTPRVTPVATTGISYAIDGEVVNGGKVTVVATVENDFGWPETLPKGWKKVDDATATFLVELIDESCIEVALGEPGVTQANCIDGGLEAPSVTLPTTVGVVYSLDGDVVSGGTATVTATLLNDYGWPAALPEGWEKVDAATATYPLKFQDIQCTPAVPVAPVTTDGTCLAGVYTAPTVTPAETEGITYTVDFDRETGEYTVTATLADSYAWGEMPDGWDEVDATTATIAGAVALNPCVDVIPVDPTTTEGTCLDGAYTAPTVTPAETEGISYQVDLDRETGEYTVIATLADGYAWGEIPAGWTDNEDGSAAYAGSDELNPCAPIVPVDPIVVQAMCTGGILVPPTVVPGTTEGIAYTTSGHVAPGKAVVITATIVEAGYAWSDTMPNGWTMVDSATATRTVRLADIACDPVAPVDPEVVQATCLDGAATTPSVTAPADGNGITYTVDPVAPHTPGQQVVVTATLAEGHAWAGGKVWPVDWEQVSPTAATYTVDLEPAECPQLELDKSADTEGPVSKGDVITYAFLVTNSGNVALTNVVVIDDHAGLVWDAANPNGAVGDLAAGESRTIHATYVVTRADVEAGSVDNIAVAIGIDPNDEEVPSNEDDVEIPVAQTPGLAIVKDADPTSGVTVGDKVVYTFTVTNTGDVSLRDVEVNDPMLFAAGVTIPAAGDLAPGESASVSATYVVTEVDVAAGKIYNVATATGQGPCPPDVAGESCPVTSPPDDATVTTEKPVTPEEPTKPEEPDTPDEPNTPDEPDTPDEPTKPEEPTTPEKPVEPTTPDEPAKPTTPKKPAKPTTPNEPVSALPSTGAGSADPAASSMLLVAMLLAAASISAGLGLRLRARR